MQRHSLGILAPEVVRRLSRSAGRLLLSTCLLLGLLVPQLAHADVQHVYDENARLAGVIDPSGNAAQYNYDAAGNDKCTRRAFEPDSLRGCPERQAR